MFIKKGTIQYHKYWVCLRNKRGRLGTSKEEQKNNNKGTITGKRNNS